MVCQGTLLNKITSILTLVILILVASALFVCPDQVEAEGNEPTSTPLPTATETPTLTLLPTDTPDQDLSSLEAKTVSQPDIAVDNNAAPLPAGEQNVQSGNQNETLGRTNLWLIGAIVLGMIFIMIMVVFGVIQRVRAE
jgi:hypothetical protein